MTDKTPPPGERAITGELHAGTAPLDVNPDLFDPLSNRRRRYVLFSLMDMTDGVAELDDLADQLQRWERTVDDDVPTDHRDRIVAALHHVDLPKLADAGVLEFDQRSGTVRYRGDDALEAALELVVAMADG